jgi:hypothetical protein
MVRAVEQDERDEGAMPDCARCLMTSGGTRTKAASIFAAAAAGAIPTTTFNEEYAA